MMDHITKMELQSIKNIQLLRTLFLILFLGVKVTQAQDKRIGSVKVSESAWLDETEVDVASWLSFYSWTIIHDGYDKAQMLLPDSNKIEPELWRYIKTRSYDNIHENAKYSNQPIGYFRKECQEYDRFLRRLPSEKRYCSLLNFPITGITFEQAVLFCMWRTKIDGKGTYTYQLPTPDEWKQFSLTSLTTKEKQNRVKDSCIQNASPNFNFYFKDYCPTCIEVGTIFGVAMFDRDENKLYDVFGNVSEMTSEKGISKGGNFTLFANQCHVDSVQYYSGAKKWLGFRCIAKRSKLDTDIVTVNTLNSDTSMSRFNSFVDSRDQRVYPTVIIGKQTWMSMNLTFKPDSGVYWVYKDSEAYADEYGYLYSWESAKNACPIGWHLPSKSEYEELLFTVSNGSAFEAYKALRPSGKSGMSIVDCSLRYGGQYTPVEGGVAYWSSTENNKKYVWGLGIGGLSPTASLYKTYKKKSGLPVRCIKD